MFGNISHYHNIQNKGAVKPTKRDQIRWHNDLDKKKYEDIVEFNPAEYFAHPGAISFPLKTIYPGLLIGSGYAHPALFKPKENETGDFQLGFFFDHTTGLPVIPGSSVKGVLKSVFPSENKDKDSYEKKKIIEGKNKNKLEYIRELLKNKTNNADLILQNWQKVFFERKHVFLEAYLTDVDENTAVVEKTNTADKKEKHLFADDYITPHTGGIFKNPIPIRFLKVAPGVIFTFQFLLKDCMKSDLQKLNSGEINVEIISKENILEVFKQILINFGIGAKRNVGYGNFKEK